MDRRRLPLLASLVTALIVGVFGGGSLQGRPGRDLPVRLTDSEFWRLTEDMSEPNGSFQSDNLLSNEIVFARLVPELVSRTTPGGVYLGVGPEQNFTYMAAIRPGIAIITDIRRGNLHTHLMYKALFELSADRAEFVSRLFNKPRPAGLGAASTVAEIMDAFWDVPTSNEAAYNANLEAIQRHLTKTRSIPLPPEDLDGIARVYRTFHWYGPAMNYSASTTLGLAGAGRGTNYRDLMVQADNQGKTSSFLATEDKFAFLKDLEQKNLVIPIVGNFSGPKALRSVGVYLRGLDAKVTAFYLSNVESYLQRAGTWNDFCANVATMPIDERSLFIRPSGGGGNVRVLMAPPSSSGATPARIQIINGMLNGAAPTGRALTAGLVSIAEEVKSCAAPKTP